MTSRPLVLAFLAGALVIGLVATSVAAVAGWRRAADRQDRVDALTAEVADLRGEVARLETELADGGSSGDPLDGLLDGLLGGGGGDLDGLLGGLLSGSGGGVPGMRCMTGAGAGLDGLLGGGGGDLGGLFDSLLGGGSAGSDATDPDEVVDEIADQVATARELAFADEVEVDFLDDAAIAAELEAILDEGLDPELLDHQGTVLTALRAIPSDTDLEQLNRDLLEEQVAGFYDPEDGRLVVRTPDDGQLRTIDRVTLAHELQHALADQAIGLPDLDDGTDADAALARLAVVEGDATLLMNLWTLEHLSMPEQLSLATDGDLLGQQAQLEDVPHHLARELVFPYTAGMDLVCDTYLDGGWAAVDARYQAPPTTTAGVLFPDRVDDTALPVPSLTAPAGGRELMVDTFGAAPLLWLLEAPGGATDAALDDPLDRVAAWGGGEVRLWEVDGDRAVGLALTDRDAGDPPLCDTVTAWYAAAAPDADRGGGSGGVTTFSGTDGSAAIRCDGTGVTVGFAPEVTTAREVVDGG